ncbi:O-antigen ligase family protein [Patescibacteria group bacterium]|nr:O-antigen ligase family protein [Patescibacteria group bacterium]
MLLILAALIVIGYAIIAWRDFPLALKVLMALLPTYLLRFNIGPIPTTLLELLVIASIIIFTIKYQAWKLFPLQILGPYRTPLLLLIAAASVSAALAPDIFSALGIWKAFYLEPMAVLIMMRVTWKAKNDYLEAIGALGASVGIMTVFALFQVTTGFGIPLPWDIERRATGFFEYPNALGLFVAPIVALTTTLAILTKKHRKSLLSLSAIGILAILLAQTEAALIAIPIGMLCSLLCANISSKQKIALIGATCLLGVTALLIPITREKILLRDWSGQARLHTWQETFELLKDHPLKGAGLNGFPIAITPYHDATLFETFQYPHNIILNVWVELGALGLIALIAFMLATAKVVRSSNHDPLTLAAFAALCTLCIHGLVDVPLMKNDLAIIGALLFAMMLSRAQSTPLPERK